MIDQIKEEVDKVCGRAVVSCADILAVAARDSVVAVSGCAYIEFFLVNIHATNQCNSSYLHMNC